MDPSNPMGITNAEVAQYPLYGTNEAKQCRAAHAEDLRKCVGAFDAVSVIDQAHGQTDACVLHAAVALKSLVNGRLRGGSEQGAAIAAYELAKELPPHAWRGGLAEERAVELRNRYIKFSKDGDTRCFHNDLDGQGSHWRARGEKCVMADIEKPEENQW